MTMRYSITSTENGEFAAAIIDGDLFTAHDTHPGYSTIVQKLRDGDESVSNDFDATKAVAARFERLTDRVTVGGGNLFFDGDAVDNALTRQVLRFLDEGVEDWQPLVNFFEKASANPNEHSRDQLFDWLGRFDFAITPDGDFIAYKGVRKTADGFESISRGPAVVDGIPVNGAVPNNPGSVVEIARSRVVHDPATGCASGLHAGTWDYASGFAQGATLTVKINPRDVVSVPTDCGWQKIRTCRYTVIEVTETAIARAFVDDDDEDVYGPSDIHEVAGL